MIVNTVSQLSGRKRKFYSNEYLIKNVIDFDHFKKILRDYVIFKPSTKDELVKAVVLWCSDSRHEAEEKYGHISIWDVSNIIDMSNLFALKELNDDISKWDVSNVTNMSNMFFSSTINSPLDSWNVSSVKDMSCMFRRSNFNHSIQSWDVRNVTTMELMFAENDYFNQNLNDWKIQSVTNMKCMFMGAEEFNYPLDRWNVSHVTDMCNMFAFTDNFNQDLNDWDMSSIKTIQGMFRNSIFNKSLTKWDLSKIENIFGIFMNCHNFNFQENINFDNWNNFSVTIFEDIVGCSDNNDEYDFDDNYYSEDEDTPSHSNLNAIDMENFHKINIYLGEEKHKLKFQNVLHELKQTQTNNHQIKN